MLHLKKFFFFLSFILSFFTSQSHSSDKPTVPEKIVETLKVNTVFFPSRTFFFLPNAVYCVSVTITSTPTLRGRHKSAPTILTETSCSLI